MPAPCSCLLNHERGDNPDRTFHNCEVTKTLIQVFELNKIDADSTENCTPFRTMALFSDSKFIRFERTGNKKSN